MQELHAFANGDGSFTVQIIGRSPEGFRQYVNPHAYIKTDGLVLDEIPQMQSVHFQFGNQEIPPEVFQQFMNQAHP